MVGLDKSGIFVVYGITSQLRAVMAPTDIGEPKLARDARGGKEMENQS